MNDAAAQSCLYEQAAQGSDRITVPGGVRENVDVAFGDIVSGHGDGSTVGVDVLSGLFQPR